MRSANQKGKRMGPYRVLIIEDQPEIIEYCSQFISNGFIYNAINTGKEIENVLKCSNYDIVLLDKDFSHISKDLLLGPPSRATVEGLEILKKIRSFDINLPVIMITGFGDYESVSMAFRLGVFDYIESEVLTKDELILRRKMENAICGLSVRFKDLLDRYNRAGIIGKSKPMLEILKQLEEALKSDSNILLLGETGVGKDAIAKVIHSISDRSDGPFIRCDMTQVELLESSLFGHVKGSFTGALADRKGFFELADGGVILLNEIGELPLEMQAKLLVVLEDREFYPKGSEKPVRFDARIIAATNRDLNQALKNGTFRRDLFVRLAQIKITIPPLSRRRDDIPLLVRHFIDLYCQKYELSSLEITDKANKYLQERNWPGNVRELRDTVAHLVRTSDGIISIRELAEYDLLHSAGTESDTSATDTQQFFLEKSMEEVQREMIIFNLKRFKGQVKPAYETMKIPKSTMYDLINKYDLKHLAKNYSSVSE